MRSPSLSFAYEYDVVIDRGEIKKRKKKPSRKFRDKFGHTPLSIEEKIPWKCRQLIVGTGFAGGLPVMDAVTLGECHRDTMGRRPDLTRLLDRPCMRMRTSTTART